jgi:hypothetical protein
MAKLSAAQFGGKGVGYSLSKGTAWKASTGPKYKIRSPKSPTFKPVYKRYKAK